MTKLCQGHVVDFGSHWVVIILACSWREHAWIELVVKYDENAKAESIDHSRVKDSPFRWAAMRSPRCFTRLLYYSKFDSLATRLDEIGQDDEADL